MSPLQDLTTVGQRIANFAAELQKHMNEDTEDTAEVVTCEEDLKDALDQMQIMVVPPSSWWQSMIMNPANSAAIQVAFKTNIFVYIPTNSSIEYQKLSMLAKVAEDNLGRVLRLLGLNRILAEPEPGQFPHTPLSLAARTSEAFKGAEFLFSMFSRAGASLYEAIISTKEGYTAWVEAFGAPVYHFFKNHPTEREQFGMALAALAAPDMEDLADMFPWGSLTKLVDLGGGAGHVAVTLARKHTELRVTNQDLPGVIKDCKKAVAEMPLDDLERRVYSRINFESYDFYVPQPESDADA
jgi:hypothetical protein